MPFLAVGYLVKGLYFAKKKFGADYVAGIKEAFEHLHEIKKEPFQWKYFGNYLVIQLELYINTWKIWKEKMNKN